MRLFEWIVGKSTKSECDRLKDENERLSKQIVSLLGEIQEASAKYDFETARLEKKIAELLENKERLIKTLQESEKHLVDRQWKIDTLHNENSSLEADLCMLQDEIQSLKRLAKKEIELKVDPSKVISLNKPKPHWVAQIEHEIKKRGRPRKQRD